MKRFLETILVLIYAAISITVTMLLLSYNDYKVSELGGKTFYIVNKNINETYRKGSLLVIDSASEADIKVGDNVFIYRKNQKNGYDVVLDKVIDISTVGESKTYYFEGDYQYSIDYILGREDDTVIYEKLGTILGIFESRWGYLFLVVIVTLLLLLQEIFDLVVELKTIKEGKDANANA